MQIFLLDSLLFGFDNCGVLNPGQVGGRNNDCVLLIIGFSLGSDGSQLVKRNHVCTCVLGGLLLATEEGFVDK
jgi:hypothetical protein